MNNKENEKPIYLAQDRLFDRITSLRNDIIVPDYICVSESVNPVINIWFGPSNILSPLHKDPYHKLRDDEQRGAMGEKHLDLIAVWSQTACS